MNIVLTITCVCIAGFSAFTGCKYDVTQATRLSKGHAQCGKKALKYLNAQCICCKLAVNAYIAYATEKFLLVFILSHTPSSRGELFSKISCQGDFLDGKLFVCLWPNEVDVRKI